MFFDGTLISEVWLVRDVSLVAFLVLYVDPGS